jgi:hypothetical protein
MSKLVAEAIFSARALCQDALGNGSSGNTERSLRFVAEAVQVLNAVADLHTAKGKVTAEMQAEKNLRAALAAAGDKADWPKFEMNAEALEQFKDAAWLQELLVVHQR